MEYKTLRTTPSVIDRSLLPHVSGLLAYAASDPSFGASLAAHTQNKNWRPRADKPILQPNLHIQPTTQEEAITITRWLFDYLDDTPSARSTREILATWAQHFEVPRDFVIGIIGLAIMGPTLGIQESKKKNKSVLRTIVDETWYKEQTTAQCIEQIQANNQRVIAAELRMAGGRAYRLHPDTASWCLEEANTKLYFTNQDELTTLHIVASQEHLSHQTVRDGERVVMVSLSPTIKETFETSFDVRVL